MRSHVSTSALAALIVCAAGIARAEDAPPPAAPLAASTPLDADLAAIRAEADPGKQRTAILALHAKATVAFLALPQATLAALAPSVLRVYDLSESLREATDMPEPPTLEPIAEGEGRSIPPPEGPQARTTRRVAEAIRAAWGPIAAGAAPRFASASATGTALVVLGDDAGYTAAERVLDRLAAVGEPTRLLDVRWLESQPLATELGLLDLPVGAVRRAPDRLPAEATLAAAQRVRFGLPLTRGRRTSAWRAVTYAYVQDADVRDTKIEVADPVVGALPTGLSVAATFERGPDGGADRVAMRLARSEPGLLPFETFATVLSLGLSRLPVTIDLPELHVSRCEASLALDADAGRYLVRMAPPGTFALVEASAPEPGRVPAGRGWARIAADAADGAPAAPPVVSFTASLAASDGAAHGSVATITAGEGDSASAGFSTSVAYIADVDVDGEKGLVDPVVATQSEGTWVEVTPRAAVGERRAVDVVVRTRRVDRPMRRVPFRLAPGKPPITLDLPTSREVVRSYRATLARGERLGLPAFLGREGAPARPAMVTLTYLGEGDPGATAPTVGASGSPRNLESALATVRAASDPAARANAVEAARAVSQAAFLGLSVGDLAGLAPDVLRVYDLSTALESGGDGPVPEGLDVPGEPREPDDGVPTPAGRRARRIAQEVEHALAPMKPGDAPAFALVRDLATAPHDPRAARATLLVLAPPTAFEAVERTLDRVATTGGPVVRVQVDVLRDDALYGRLALDRGGHPVSAAVREALAGLESTRIARFEFEVPHQRTVTAWRDVSSAYLVGVDPSDPAGTSRGFVGHGREALVVRGLLEAGVKSHEPKLGISLGTATGGGPVAPRTPAPGERTPGWSGPESRLRWSDVGFLVGTAPVDAVEPMEDRALVAVIHARRLPDAFPPVARGWSRVEGPASTQAAVPDVLTVAVSLRDPQTDATYGQGRMGATAGQEVAFDEIRRTAILADAVVPPDGSAPASTRARMLEDGTRVTMTWGPRVEGRRLALGLVRTRWHDLPLRQGELTLPSGTRHAVHLPVEREVAQPFRLELAPGGEARLPVRFLRPDGTAATTTLVVRYVGDGVVPDLDVPAPK